jgi:hypothetical protein
MDKKRYIVHADLNKVCFIEILSPVISRRILKIIYLNKNYVPSTDNAQFVDLFNSISRELKEQIAQER